MKVPMGPPSPSNPSSSSTDTDSSSDTQMNPQSDLSNPVTMKVPMGPPPPKNINPPKIVDTSLLAEPQIIAQEETQVNNSETHVPESDRKIPENNNSRPNSRSASGESPSVAVPYTIPSWSEAPCHPFFFEVLKDGSIIDHFDVSQKGAYMFGRVDLCDFVLEHPTISRFHAVLQFNKDGDAYLYDIGSTHGTFVNKQQVKKKEYMGLHVGDVIRFGHSSRLYIFQGPSELMPPENDLANIRNAKIREEMQDREASLLRARQQATLAEGISWGMAEDAVEEDEEDADEVTWQTYKGQLTEKQEKTRDKIIKRTEKVANMKREIDSIRAKDIAQGGLTQGQQTQIARNEQRISQVKSLAKVIMEEIESLEETLNESIQESIGAHAGKVIRGKKGVTEEEDEVLSDDDEFYDRTKKKKPASLKTGDHQSIETADTLLAKKEAIINEMEEKKKLLLTEKSKVAPEMEGGNDDGDALDAYMTGLSSQLVLDRTVQIQDELSTLQSELDRILYLLKIADPTGEAARKRVQVSKSSQQDRPTSGVTKQLPAEQKKISTSTKPRNGSTIKEGTENATIQASKQQEADQNVNEATESKPPIYRVSKPQWLGATQDMEIKEIKHDEVPVSVNEPDQFVDYKDRKKALGTVDETQEKESGIESAAPGLIIRKRKQVEKSEETNEAKQSMYSSTGAETTAADAVALLLKHKRGYYALEDEERTESQDTRGGMESRKDNARPRRVLGPERPAFLNSSPDYESWMPPEGQSGDGRTSLNDRYGY